MTLLRAIKENSTPPLPSPPLPPLFSPLLGSPLLFAQIQVLNSGGIKNIGGANEVPIIGIHILRAVNREGRIGSIRC